MAKKKLGFPSRLPIDLSKTAWFYEERGHIKVISELRSTTTTTTGVGATTQYLGTTHTAIPMRKLCRVVDRYRKWKRKRSAAT